MSVPRPTAVFVRIPCHVAEVPLPEFKQAYTIDQGERPAKVPGTDFAPLIYREQEVSGPFSYCLGIPRLKVRSDTWASR
jgi:hypothetical protein